jgi:hypothetical protein
MTNHLLGDISLQQLRRAVEVRERIAGLEKELDRIIGGRSAVAGKRGPSKKGKLSAASRARISAAMKARWAKVKGPRRLSSRSRPAARARKQVAAGAKRASSHGPLKERIVRALMAAGPSGVTVKEMAVKLGKSYGSISVWFHTTGKRVKEIKKVAPGEFAWAS